MDGVTQFNVIRATIPQTTQNVVIPVKTGIYTSVSPETSDL